MENERQLRRIATDLTHKYFGNSLEIGKFFIYKAYNTHKEENKECFDKPIKITGGQFMGTYGLSNFWDWKIVQPDGTLSEKAYCGYGGDDSVFVPITEEEAWRIARGEEAEE